jgi:hypothetical protein
MNKSGVILLHCGGPEGITPMPQQLTSAVYGDKMAANPAKNKSKNGLRRGIVKNFNIFNRKCLILIKLCEIY